MRYEEAKMKHDISRRSIILGSLALSTTAACASPVLAGLAPDGTSFREPMAAPRIGREWIDHELAFTEALVENGHRVLQRFLMCGDRPGDKPTYFLVDFSRSAKDRAQEFAHLSNYFAETGCEAFIHSEANEKLVTARYVTRNSMNVVSCPIQADGIVRQHCKLHAIRQLTPEHLPAHIADLLPPTRVRPSIAERRAMEDFLDSYRVFVSVARM